MGTLTFDKAYRAALKAVAKDAREISGGPKIAPHLRVATKSHARYATRRALVAGGKNVKLSDLAKTHDAGREPPFSGEGGGNSDELLLYMDNDQPTYQQMQAVQKNMIRCLRNGTYNSDLAPQGWMHSTNFGSQRYKEEIGTEGIEWANRGKGGHAFSNSIRNEVVDYLAWRFMRDAQSGEFDE